MGSEDPGGEGLEGCILVESDSERGAIQEDYTHVLMAELAPDLQKATL